MENVDKSATHSVAEELSFKNLNLESLGIMLAITWFGAMLWSPNVVPDYFVISGMDFGVHMLRLALLGMLCVIYLLVQFFPQLVLNERVKQGGVIIGALFSPLPLVCNLSEMLGLFFQAHLALFYISWALSGFSAAVMMLIWGYDMQTKSSYMQGVVNIASSSIFSGAVYILLAFLETKASMILIMVMPFTMIASWFVCRGKRSAVSGGTEVKHPVAHPIALTNVRVALGGGTNVFIFSYGFVMGLAGAVGTQFSIMHSSYIFVGTAAMAAGFSAFFAIKMGLEAKKAVFAAFLPFSTTCFFLLSVVGGAGKIILLWLIFFLINFYNVINTAYTGEKEVAGANAYSRTYDFFSCEARVFDMMGSAVGWLLGSVIELRIDHSQSIIAFFLLAVVLVAASVSFLVSDMGSSSSGKAKEDSPAFKLVMEEWVKTCESLAKQYKLSARESEILLLLARGRNREFIHSKLFISSSTVRSHTYSIYQKMGIHNQQELIDTVEAELQNKQGSR